MAFYENTIIARQDLAQKDLGYKKKYSDLINSASGKVIKTEEWGLLVLQIILKNTKKVFTFITNLKVIVRHLRRLKKLN